jgi:triosephosphate isomerase
MSGSAARPRVIAANWKMNKAPAEAAAFFDDFLPACPERAGRTVLFFPPAISFAACVRPVAFREDLGLGVQNVHWDSSGAFTGEISATMAASAGARYALAGHSERRHIFGETDEMVARKAAAIAGAGLKPIVCVGETIDERRAGRLEEVLARQLHAVTAALPRDRARAILIAYEPVWAIGTGVNATPDDAAAAHGFLRSLLARSDADAAARIPILYGGSVKPDNAAELLAATDVDGLLVGGASLDPSGFARIVAAA